MKVNGLSSTATGLSEIYAYDRQFSAGYIGNSRINAGRGLNGDIAGLFVTDEYLSETATAAIADAMKQGVDLTNRTCPDTCTTCASGTYKSATGSAVCTNCLAGTYSATTGASAAATCLACPANSNSPAGSTAAASCACNAGFALSNNVCVCGLGYEPGT